MRDMDVELLEVITSIIPEPESSEEPLEVIEPIIPEPESSDDNTRTVKKTKGGQKK